MRKGIIAAVILAGGIFEGQVWAGEDARGPALPDAQANFAEVKALIEEHYVGDVSPEDLWTGATEGMLNRLLQMDGHPINQLLSPAEMDQLQAGIKGEISGIGILIDNSTGVLIVTQVLDGGGAKTAGLRADDRILSIDGTTVKGMPLAEVAGRIRGTSGSKVKLLVQRDTEEWTVEVTRSPVVVPNVWGAMVGDDAAVVGIASFTERTPDEVRKQMEALRAKGARRVILDLRSCPGGLLDAAVTVAEDFLPKGATVVSLDWGGAEGREVRAAKKKGAFADMPVAVLLSHQSASGAEILAAALSENDRGLILGETSSGKGTVEKIFELEGGWAVKLSVAYFYSPDGHSWQGVGITPDVPITLATSAARVDPQADPAVLAARSVLKVSR